MKILTVFGTHPETMKLASVVKSLAGYSAFKANINNTVGWSTTRISGGSIGNCRFDFYVDQVLFNPAC